MKIMPTYTPRAISQDKLMAYGWVISILTIWLFTANRF